MAPPECSVIGKSEKRWSATNRALRSFAGAWLILLSVLCCAQNGPDAQPTPDTSPEPAADMVTMFTHSQTARYWISGQDNIIFQWHPAFDSKYSGPNSLNAKAENATSHVGTLFLGYEVTKHVEAFADIEEASGGGLSDALGLAGETNLDVVRNPLLSKSPYLARAFIRAIIPLSKQQIEVERGPFALATQLPARRLELRAGKFGTADYFDMNEVGSDSHFQFQNWTVDNNGAYDYAADTRGYTVGVIASYYDVKWAFRFAEALMPKVANGPDLVWNLSKARAENYELELHPGRSGGATIVRLLAFMNHANMGVYRNAIADFEAGLTSRPAITAHPFHTTVKYGFGINLEHDFSRSLRGFARWGWNEGGHESYAYTEVDETFAVGADLIGNRWRRRLDKVGAAFVSNGISAYHQQYLALGGTGFLLGDGGLRYGRENLEEVYYNAHIWRGFFFGPDVQHINNPGYNRNRGPVWVAGCRFHLEF